MLLNCRENNTFLHNAVFKCFAKIWESRKMIKLKNVLDIVGTVYHLVIYM